MSKGSNRRPSSVPPDEFARRWDEAFGCSDKEKKRQWMRAHVRTKQSIPTVLDEAINKIVENKQ